MGFRDGGEDCERFRRACFDSRVLSAPSLLLRSAFADAVTLRDPANNLKLAKARSKGRIDAAAATVLAVAEGARRSARPAAKARAATWVCGTATASIAMPAGPRCARRRIGAMASNDKTTESVAAWRGRRYGGDGREVSVGGDQGG